MIIRAFLILAASATTAVAQAPQPPVGNFALDAASCRAKDYFLVLKRDSMDLPVFSCQGLKYLLRDQTGDRARWQVDGRKCQGEHAGSGGPKRFQVESSPQAVRIFWPDGTRSSAFVKCTP